MKLKKKASGVLDYVIEVCLHTHRRALQWQEAEPNNTLPWLLPGPAQEPSAHQGPTSASPDEQETGGNPN